METKASRLKAAVVDGIARGWTAKETAYHNNFKETDIRRAAYLMRLSFPWSRFGMPPKFSSEAVPLTTLFRRHRHTSAHAARLINKLVLKVGPKSPHALELLKVASFLKKRSFPEAWEGRINVSK